MPQEVDWTLREAIRRTVDPDLLTQCMSGEREWRKAGAPRRFVHSFGVDRPLGEENGRNRHFQALRSAQLSTASAVAESLRAYLISGQLVARGRRGSPLGEITSIPASAWKVLKFKDFGRSIVTEPGPNKAAIYDLRIVPALHADNAAHRLDDEPLVRAFDLFVFNDPQVASLRKRAIVRGGEPRTVGFQSRLYHAYWYVDHGTKSGDDPTGFLLDGDYRAASRPAEDALQDRFRRLVKLLIDGEIVAEGALYGQGGITEISRAMWLRKTAVLDLYEGDFYDRYPDPGGDGEERVAPLYLGLMLRRPKIEASQKLHVKPTANDQAPSITIKDVEDTPLPTAAKSKAVDAVKTSLQVRQECTDWLEEEMRRSPAHKPHPKAHWRRVAAARWGALLSYRSFDDAWDEAVKKSGAAVWKAAGAPKRSDQ